MKHARLVVALLAVAGLLIALRRAGGSVEDVQRVGLETSAAAVLLMTVAVLGVGVIWAALVSWLNSERVNRNRLFRSFLLTWPARYVPGTIPYHAGRVLAAEDFGATRASAIAAVGYEAIVQLGAAALIGITGVLMALGARESAGSIYFVLLTPLVALPVLLQPAVLVPTANFALRLVKRPALQSGIVLSSTRTAQALIGYSAAYTLNGIAFYLVLNAVTEGNPNLLLALGAYSLGGAAGVLVLFVPSGMAVREAVIIAVMSTAHPAESVLLAAALTRAFSVIADLLPLALIVCAETAGRSLRFLSPANSGVTNHR